MLPIRINRSKPQELELLNERVGQAKVMGVRRPSETTFGNVDVGLLAAARR